MSVKIPTLAKTVESIRGWLAGCTNEEQVDLCVSAGEALILDRFKADKEFDELCREAEKKKNEILKPQGL